MRERRCRISLADINNRTQWNEVSVLTVIARAFVPATLLTALLATPLVGQTDTVGVRRRLRFAEMTLGMDGLAPSVRVPSRLLPRLTLGGTHFWAWSEFYLAFPLSSAALGSRGPTDAGFVTGIETGARVYAAPLTEGRLRPFAAMAFGRVSVREQRGGMRGPTVTSLRAIPSVGASWAVGRLLSKAAYSGLAVAR